MKSSFLRRPVAIALSLLLAAVQTVAVASAAEVVVDPVGPDVPLYSRPIVAPAYGEYSVAQSFRAEDERVRFGFRLAGEEVLDPDEQDPFAGVMLTYRLYKGDSSSRHPGRLLATRHVAMPGTLSDDPIRAQFGDVGFVEADFSRVRLTPGATYTMEITRQLDTRAGISVWHSVNNPYAYGLMSIPPRFDPASPEDAHFRMTPVRWTPRARVAALRRWIASAPGIASTDRKLLISTLHKTLTKPELPAYQRVACSRLDSFIRYVDQHSHRFDDATAVHLFDQAELIKTGIPCR